MLPCGGTAATGRLPAASSSSAPDRAIERCLGFALDGWNVVRLVDHDKARGPWIQRIRYLSERLAARKVPDDLPVLLFTNADDGCYPKTETQLSALDTALNATSRQGGLAIIFRTIGTAAGRRLRAVMSNGLAG